MGTSRPARLKPKANVEVLSNVTFEVGGLDSLGYDDGSPFYLDVAITAAAFWGNPELEHLDKLDVYIGQWDFGQRPSTHHGQVVSHQHSVAGPFSLDAGPIFVFVELSVAAGSAASAAGVPVDGVEFRLSVGSPAATTVLEAGIAIGQDIGGRISNNRKYQTPAFTHDTGDIHSIKPQNTQARLLYVAVDICPSNAAEASEEPAVDLVVSCVGGSAASGCSGSSAPVVLATLSSKFGRLDGVFSLGLSPGYGAARLKLEVVLKKGFVSTSSHRVNIAFFDLKGDQGGDADGVADEGQGAFNTVC